MGSVREPAIAAPHATVYAGDVREVLAEMPSELVHTIVTSPPYWNQRDYDTAGQIGLEKTPGEYVTAIRATFEELRRVLRKDGTLWLNMGDGWANRVHGKSQTYGSSDGVLGRGPRPTPMRTAVGGLKVKDLIGMPWRIALALQEDGWYLRQEIIWYKPNVIPESAHDRPSRAHEQVFLFSKRRTGYFFDYMAIAEPVTGGTHARGPAGPQALPKTVDGQRDNRSFAEATWGPVDVRNSRSVWEIPTESYPEAHFATFPRELPRRCIAAGTPEAGVCATCGAPWRRGTRGVGGAIGHSWNVEKGLRVGQHVADPRAKGGRGFYKRQVEGWRQSCACEILEAPAPAVVLDPFAGSGTTLEVAIAMGRQAVGIELASDYLPMIERRCAAGELERSRREVDGPLRAAPVSDLGPLWDGTASVDEDKHGYVKKRQYQGFNARWDAQGR